jgi:endogenous inhibitor of DNA gyrase (YacG/DUF329 family)
VRLCPICGKPVAAGHYPFCSSRCAKVDLNRWLSGTYVIPARADEEGAQEPEPETPTPANRTEKPGRA